MFASTVYVKYSQVHGGGWRVCGISNDGVATLVLNRPAGGGCIFISTPLHLLSV